MSDREGTALVGKTELVSKFHFLGMEPVGMRGREPTNPPDPGSPEGASSSPFPGPCRLALTQAAPVRKAVSRLC